jgi:eukaryotic-like serine/threonine-protein kinase
MKECPRCRRCYADKENHCLEDGDTLNPSLPGEPALDGRYHLERRIGQGGMGVVYKARHTFLKTSHAIKIILPDIIGNDTNLTTRFRQEAMAAAAIRHQNVVAVTDFGVLNNMPFLVMEYIKGRSLQEILSERGRLSVDEAIEIITGVGEGVQAAHRIGIVHRDIKPLNIMLQDDLSPSEGVKVLDFGLAKIKSGELLGSFVQAKTVGLMGSPMYMAPEQWSDDEPDLKADIYSLGIILYQMISGEVPFRGSSIPSVMKKHLTLDPPSFATHGIKVNRAIEEVIFRALSKEPERRQQSVSELLKELRDAQSQPFIDETTATLTSIDMPDQMARTMMPSGYLTRSFTEDEPPVIKDESIELLPDLEGENIVRESVQAEDVHTPKQDLKRLALPALIAASGLLVIMAGVMGLIYLLKRPDVPKPQATVKTVSPVPVAKATGLIWIEGGEFEIGLREMPDVEPTQPDAFLWNFVQWPARRVSIRGFYIDETEVTNREYSQFIEATKSEPPPHWTTRTPPLEQEDWPVYGVSYLDALEFAKWRGLRDGKAYRLPAEEEWEFVATSRGKYKRYPWGDEWEEGHANLNAQSVLPAGSLTKSSTAEGVKDMVGNVWEWTSSNSSVYRGNERVRLPDSQKGWYVVRGGDFNDSHKGRKAITVTSRQWFPSETRRTKEDLIGFRLAADK